MGPEFFHDFSRLVQPYSGTLLQHNLPEWYGQSRPRTRLSHALLQHTAREVVNITFEVVLSENVSAISVQGL